MTSILMRREDQDTDTSRKDHVKTQEEVSRPQAEQRGLRRNLPC